MDDKVIIKSSSLNMYIHASKTTLRWTIHGNLLQPAKPLLLALLLIILYSSSCFTIARRDLILQLGPVFSNNMVLQRQQPIRIWGTGPAFEEIQISLGQLTRWTQIRSDGTWQVEFPCFEAGGPYSISIGPNQSNLVRDIMIGDLFFCSGQSNMSLPMNRLTAPQGNIESVNDPLLRIFYPGSGWQQSSPSSVQNCSAIAYFFGKYLRNKLKIPIGLIVSTSPGTPIRSWMNSKHLNYLPKNLKSILPNGYLDRTQIAPFCQLGLTAFLWYQGEADLENSSLYQQSFERLISDWRERWSRGNIPVLFVQLPNMGKRFNHPVDSYWAQFREVQDKCKAIPNCFMAVTCDTATENVPPLHPKSGKNEVARRLALLALQNIYRMPVFCSFPSPCGFKQNQFSFEIEYYGGPIIMHNLPASGFELAGNDGIFHNAEVSSLEPNKIILRAYAVTKPKFVRYAWSDNPHCSVYSVGGLPGLPFRTDKIPPREQFVEAQDYGR